MTMMKELEGTGAIVVLQAWDDAIDDRSAFKTFGNFLRMDLLLAPFLQRGLRLENILFIGDPANTATTALYLSSRSISPDHLFNFVSTESISFLQKIVENCSSLMILSSSFVLNPSSSLFQTSNLFTTNPPSFYLRNMENLTCFHFLSSRVKMLVLENALTSLHTHFSNSRDYPGSVLSFFNHIESEIVFDEKVEENVSGVVDVHQLDLLREQHLAWSASLLATMPGHIEESCYARVGLMGNPSDGFRGKTVSFLIKNFAATVSIRFSPASPHDISLRETANFQHLNHLYFQSTHVGYTTGLRLLQATCKIFVSYCERAGVLQHRLRGFEMQFQTNIPRMVGLSGSSAIIVATFNALLRYYQLTLSDLHITQETYPEVILSIERDELGISAGLQDRVIQTYGGLVHMDFTRSAEKHENVYTSLDPKLLPPFYLAYNTAAGGESGKVHSTVKQRWLEQDSELLEGMHTLGQYADEAKDCLLQQNWSRLADLMDLNFIMRRKLYGDAVVGKKNLAVAQLLHQHHMSAKFSGSGGAILCLRRDGLGWLDESEEQVIADALAVHEYKFIRVEIP